VSLSEPQEPVGAAPKVVEPLRPDEMPPWIRRFDIVLVLAGLVTLVLVQWAMPTADPQAVLQGWLQEFAQDFARGQIGDGHWTLDRRTFPAVPAYLVVPSEYLAAARASVSDAGVQVSDIYTPTPRLYAESAMAARNDERQEFLLQIRGGLLLGLDVEYWPGRTKVPAFSWSRGRGQGLMNPWRSLAVFLVAAVGYGSRVIVIERYRRRRQQEFADYDQSRTTSIFESRARLATARTLWQQGETAKALVTLDAILRDTPGSAEARVLKRQISRGDDAAIAALTPAQAGATTSSPNGYRSLLMLRVLGTPYAYQAPLGAQRVALGRKRPERDDVSHDRNDVIIRVPGSDERSRRISRHHLVVERIDDDYFVRDESGGHTTVDGVVMHAAMPVRIRSGSRITLADVVTLEVAIRSELTLGRIDGLVNSGAVTAENGIQFEATIGNMYTIV